MTGETIAELPTSTPNDVEVAFGGARRAQREWASLRVRKRAEVLLRCMTSSKQAEARGLIQAAVTTFRAAASCYPGCALNVSSARFDTAATPSMAH
nr:aldehyde dehydrogenase family protein [Streptomyces sp. 142MFCol3.1]